MAIARNATNTLGTVSAGAVSTLAASWPATTTAGSTLILAVAWNPNSTNGITVTVPGGWSLATSATRTVAGADTMKSAVYVKQNASAASGSVSVTFSSASYATLHLVEITGAATASLDATATDNASSLSSDTGTTATTGQANEYLFGLISNANSATTQTGAPTNSFTQVDQQTSTGTGTDHINSAIYNRNVTATGTYGTTVGLSGVTSRSWVGIIITLKEAAASGAQIQASFGVATGGGDFHSWTGMSARTTSADVSSQSTAYSGTFNLRSCYKYWYQFEPSAPTNINTGTYDWTGLSTSIQAAADSQLTANPWRLIFRIEMGFASPAWLFTTSVQPVTEWFFVDAASNTSPGASAHNNHVPRIFDGTGAYDTNLLAHQTRMLKAINTYLQQSDGHGHMLGDWVYFMAIAMPTVQPGTEMTTQTGPATSLPAGFNYDGPSSFASGATTYRQINTNVWNSIQSNVSTRATWLKNAWITAINTHMANLTACRSAIALGSLFNDGWGGAQSIATTQGAQYGDNLVMMSTDLQTDTVPYSSLAANGPGGNYAGWSTAASQAFVNAVAAGDPLGFQTAASPILTSEAKYWAAFQSGLYDYNMAFYETATDLAAKYQNASTTGTGWPGAVAAQNLLVPTTGNNPGQIAGQATFTLTGTILAQSNLFAIDTFSRTSVNTWGSADRGGAYTLTGTAADFDVGSGSGTMIVSAANQTKEANLANLSMDDTDQRVQYSLDKLPIGAAGFARTYARKVDANNYYLLGVFITVSGAFQVHGRKVVGGVTTNLGATATVSGLTFTAGTTYWLRTSATGSSPTTLQVKIWQDSTPEPDWQYSSSDNDAILQTVGSTSIVSGLLTGATNAPVTFSYDSYQVFEFAPSLEMDGTSTFAASTTPNVVNVASGEGKVRTPRS